MTRKTIPYKKTGYFSNLIEDYLDRKKSLDSFYGKFPSVENFKFQIEEKGNSFTAEKRKILVERIKIQNSIIKLSESTAKNINLLTDENTFTITTGHQLNLFTGPLYFLYKIFSTLNLCETLKKTYPKNNFIPIYWMATEDHDFEEINYFNFQGKRIQWERNSNGAVGELSMQGLDKVFEQFKAELGDSKNAKELERLFEKSYLEHENLAEATRYLANSLFSRYGLVILDGNDAILKKAFIPYAEKEITENLSFKTIISTTEKLIELGYKEQVHPREINLFYLTENLRERIIEREGKFKIGETQKSFTKDEILNELKNHTERFSPNALLRPLYQEIILPNLCYIGGGGELAYWFQLKDYFDAIQIHFPILLLRNSVLLIPKYLSEKLKKMDVPQMDLFLPQHKLLTLRTHKISTINIDFSKQKEFLKKQFVALYELAQKTDATFVGAVAAQEKKQLNGLDKLEKRLLKAQKRNLADELERLRNIQAQLFPNESLQERQLNFSEFYMEFGESLLDFLKENLDPLDGSFTILDL